MPSIRLRIVYNLRRPHDEAHVRRLTFNKAATLSSPDRDGLWFEPLERRTLLSAPTVSLDVADVEKGGNEFHGLVVTFDDPDGLDIFSFDRFDLSVVEPGGGGQLARFVRINRQFDDTRVTATYRIDAPGGEWSPDDNGTYTVRMEANEVFDLLGNAASAGDLGTFEVNANVVILEDLQPANLGRVEGLRVVTNLNTLDGSDFFTFQMLGTGKVGDFVEVSTMIGDGLVRPVLRRVVSNNQVLVLGIERTDIEQGAAVTRRLPMAGLPPGTYSIALRHDVERCRETGSFGFEACDTDFFFNPHYTLALHASTERGVDLTGESQTQALPDVIVPGDRVRARIVMRNEGEGFARGHVDVQFYLSADQTLDAGDTPIGTANNLRTELRSGRQRTYRPVIDLPASADVVAGDYYIITHLDSGDLLPEADEADNIIVSDTTVRVERQFGTVGTRRNVRFRMRDGDGTVLTLALTGPGRGEVFGEGENAVIVLTGTTDRSALTISAIGGDRRFTIGGVEVGDVGDPADRTSIGRINARQIDFTGDVLITGTTKQLNLGDFLPTDQPHTIEVGPGGERDKVTIRAEFVNDLNVFSDTDVQLLGTRDWGETDGSADVVSAPVIRTWQTRGDVSGVDVHLTRPIGDSPRDRNLTRMTVTGRLFEVVLRSAGHIGNVVAGALFDSALFAGVRDDLLTLPTTRDDLVADASIASVALRGLVDEPFAMLNSHISAASLGRLSLREVDTQNAGVAFGLAATFYRSVTFTENGRTHRLVRSSDFTAFDPINDLTVRVL